MGQALQIKSGSKRGSNLAWKYLKNPTSVAKTQRGTIAEALTKVESTSRVSKRTKAALSACKGRTVEAQNQILPTKPQGAPRREKRLQNTQKECLSGTAKFFSPTDEEEEEEGGTELREICSQKLEFTM